MNVQWWFPPSREEHKNRRISCTDGPTYHVISSNILSNLVFTFVCQLDVIVNMKMAQQFKLFEIQNCRVYTVKRERETRWLVCLCFSFISFSRENWPYVSYFVVFPLLYDSVNESFQVAAGRRVCLLVMTWKGIRSCKFKIQRKVTSWPQPLTKPPLHVGPKIDCTFL